MGAMLIDPAATGYCMPRPSDTSLRPPQTTLANGLRVRLLPLSGHSQAAAMVRVHAGAHDALRDYAGLAHFLEHLLFLGSRGYSAEEGLMAFVQGCGGQLNASTRERHTDFFFQLPAGQLEPALHRLLDMLAHPLLDPAAQLREREVLQAEFQARARDVETLCDAALGTAFDPSHPFAGFHAGNRDTLPVEQPAFQQALVGYHRRFYHSGQIELLITGPQNHAQLQRLAELADGMLAAGCPVMRDAPPLRCSRDAWLRLHIGGAEPRLNLLFSLEHMPEHSQAALDVLSFAITSQAQHGFARRLRDAGLCHSVRLRTPYWFAGQGVVVVELSLTEHGLGERAAIVEAVLDWLRYCSGESYWQLCHDEYRRVRQRSLQGAEPLARLRHWVEPLAWSDDSDESAIRQAFAALVAQMTATGPLVMTADDCDCHPIERAGFALRLKREPPLHAEQKAWHWRPPSINPWLQAGARQYQASSMPAALHWLGPAAANGQGAFYLRWQFPAGQAAPGLRHVLRHTLQSVDWAVQQAGVRQRFDDLGDAWTLSLEGAAEAIPLILADIAELMREPAEASFIQGQRLAEREVSLGGDEMLIRQLLDRMPRLLADATPVAHCEALDASRLRAQWRSAQWQALATGFPPALSGPLTDALNALPGSASPLSIAPGRRLAGIRWHDVSGGAAMAEAALLLFCPLPQRTAVCEAAWRVLARLIEGPFFRRLRSELQLGYAVFSRFCQFGGHPGMLFAVQSPSASAEEILSHIETFLADFASSLDVLPAGAIERAVCDASDTHLVAETDLRARAEQLWQSLLAGHEADHPREVASAMRALQRQDLTAALAVLRARTAGWVVVANAAAPAAAQG